MPVRVPPDGPIPAKIMLVGEAPGDHETLKGKPFIGPSGQELDKMLGEAKIARGECFVTNLAREQPQGNNLKLFILDTKSANPKNVPSQFSRLRNKFVTREIHEGFDLLKREIAAVKPNVIVPMGNAALWALTNHWGITRWRGSMLYGCEDIGAQDIKVIPTIHPAAVLYEWSYRATVVNDFRRVVRHRNGEPYPKPKWDFIIEPTYEQCIDTLYRVLYLVRQSPIRLSFDLETRFGHIDCAGLSWSLTQAICIPFLRGNNAAYWEEAQEGEITWLLWQILVHPNAQVVGQNILYDCQYTYRHWHFVPNVAQDCMISQHSIYSDLPKSLAYQASMYCNYYVYWKEEGKHRNPEVGDRSHWYYNCEDVVYTDEVGRVELAVVEAYKLQKVHEAQQKLLWPVLKAMQTGVRIDIEKRKELDDEVSHHLELRKQFLRDILGHDLNPQSPKKMHTLFYKDLNLPVQMTRAKKGIPARPTLDDDAMQKLVLKEPLIKPLVNCIADLRTLNIFRSTFLRAELDIDGRMRTAYNIGGSESGKSAPKTYRLSSSENAFGSGANLQNIPSEKSKSLGKAAARGGIAGLGDHYQFPNIRSMFVPDPGYTFFDGDLDRADLQVVAWEADEPLLKTALKIGADIHLMNCYLIEGRDPPPLEELVETHPKYHDHRGPRKMLREFAKVFCHACVDEKHEALTRNGWKKVKDITDECIMICNPDGSDAHYEQPKDWFRGPCNSDMILFKGEAIEQHVTWDHRMGYTTDNSAWSITTASNLPGSARLAKSVQYNGPIVYKYPELLAAFQADGYVDDYGNIYFHFHKDRKIERLQQLLEGLEYSLYSGETTKFYIPHRQASQLKLEKALDSHCLEWSHDTAVRYLKEQVYWDGYKGITSAEWMSSIDETRADLAHTLAHLHGFGSQRSLAIRDDRKPLHRWSLNNRTQWRLASVRQMRHPGNGQAVYCPVTSTGFWLTRRNGLISVTGNTNYGGKSRTVAAHTGRTIHEIDTAQKKWFATNRGIARWHIRTASQVQRHRFVENRFGYRWYIFDRLDDVLPEALAWIPQSTVSNVINKIWQNVYDNAPWEDLQILMQVHDSLPGQFLTSKREWALNFLDSHSKIVVPYEDPLVIPFSVKTSEVSWGECK